jgi:ribosomal-protein-alanine N-acetyltransferase
MAGTFRWGVTMKPGMTIHSERLDLVPLTPEFLRAGLEQNLAEAGRAGGFLVPPDLLDCAEVLSLRLSQLEVDPALQPWLLRGMVLRKDAMMIGHIGFHTGPEPEYLRAFAPGAVEFGFEVYPTFRRQGYAREASLALMRWAKEVHGVGHFVLSIRPDNIPSQSLAASLGFVRIGSHMDEVDGVEDVLELRSLSGRDQGLGGSTPLPGV